MENSSTFGPLATSDKQPYVCRKLASSLPFVNFNSSLKHGHTTKLEQIYLLWSSTEQFSKNVSAPRGGFIVDCPFTLPKSLYYIIFISTYSDIIVTKVNLSVTLLRLNLYKLISTVYNIVPIRYAKRQYTSHFSFHP